MKRKVLRLEILGYYIEIRWEYEGGLEHLDL